MVRRPPGSTLTAHLFPVTTLFRSFGAVERLARSFELDGKEAKDGWMRDVQLRREYAAFHAELQSLRLMIRKLLIELEANPDKASPNTRSEEHTSELQSLMRTSYAVFCLKQKKKHNSNK